MPTRTEQVKALLTAGERDLLYNYAADHGVTVSNLIRTLVLNLLNGVDDDERE